MATRMTSPLAGIRWLRDGINLGARNPRTLVFAAALVLVCGIVPSLFVTALQFLFPNNQAMFFVAMGLSVLIGLALSPVFAGFLQVIHAIETGQPTRALRDLRAVSHGRLETRHRIFVADVGGVRDRLRARGVGRGPGRPPDLCGPAGGLCVRRAADADGNDAAGVPARERRRRSCAALLIGGIWTIGYGQIAIPRRGVVASLIDGIIGTLKNIPALIVLLLAAFLLSIVLVIVFLIVATVLGLIAKFVGGWLAIVLLVPLYVALALGAYIVMFGLAYAMWRDICAE